MQNNPLAMKPVQETLQSIFIQKIKEKANPVIRRGVKTSQLRGHITQEDMLRFEKYKKKFFFDY